MKRSLLALFFTLSLAIAGQTYADANSDAAQAEVKTTVESVRKLVESNRGKVENQALEKQIREVLLPIFDFDMMARSSLGANWNKGTTPQQEEFVSLFTNLLSRTYLQKIRRNIADSEISFLEPMIKGERVVVRSKVISNDENIAADYRMYSKNGKWLIYDVIIENVGLITNYRNEFSSILERKDFEALLADLRVKSESVTPER